MSTSTTPLAQKADSNGTLRYVRKRNGDLEPIAFDKITERLAKLHKQSPALPDEVDYLEVTQKVIAGVYNGIHTTELDILAAETAAHMASQHPGYDQLASRISVSNLHKQTQSDYAAVVKLLLQNTNPTTKKPAPLVSDELAEFVAEHGAEIQGWLKYERDYDFDYFAFKTLERTYLLKGNAGIIERPQHMFLRAAIGIHGKDGSMEMIHKTYDLMSTKRFTHATPTLCNAGTRFPQMFSCFLVTMKDDSIEGIYETLKQLAIISKHSGGIGFSLHNIRAAGSHINGSGGTSNGIVPMLRVFSDTAKYVDQGGNKRKGAFAAYLEPWHADVFEFLELKKPHGKEEARARDLFYALWIPDLFMKRVQENGPWSLFCPNDAPELCDLWGDAFEAKYTELEREGLARKTVKAQDLWLAILESQIETGTPYMLFKDACNRKSNQQNLGTIRSSNLCTEIVQYSSKDEIAVCNLASICLSKCVDEQYIGKLSWSAAEKGEEHHGLDIPKLFECASQLVVNLNQIIKRNYYPLPETERSNLAHSPVALGVQGLADFYHRLRIPFVSTRAKQLNQVIFEVIYYAALCTSNYLAEKDGPYSSFQGSPASKGLLQFDLWEGNITPITASMFDWNGLKEKIKATGLRNSLLVAPMPTASTSQVFGNNEGFEPYTSNIYARRTLAGDFTIVNKHLVAELMELKLWTPEIRNEIIANRGSVQGMVSIPIELRERFKTVWELPARALIDMAADRGPFIDQSQSFSLFCANPTVEKLTSMHFYSWRKGLKTGMYYLRTLPARDAKQITVNTQQLKQQRANQEEQWQRQEHEQKQRQTAAFNAPRGHSVAAAAAETVQAVVYAAAIPDITPPSEEKGGTLDISDKDGTAEICTMEDGCTNCGS